MKYTDISLLPANVKGAFTEDKDRLSWMKAFNESVKITKSAEQASFEAWEFMKDSPNCRSFEGWLSTDVLDVQNDVMDQKGLYNALRKHIDRGGAMVDVHSNRIVGSIYKVELKKYDDEHEGVYGWGVIFHDEPYFDEVWKQILKEDKNSFSLGGFAIDTKDECDAHACHRVITKPSIQEITVCKKPAVPNANMKLWNRFAKSEDPDISNFTNDNPDDALNRLVAQLMDKLKGPVGDDNNPEAQQYIPANPMEGEHIGNYIREANRDQEFADQIIEETGDNQDLETSWRTPHAVDETGITEPEFTDMNEYDARLNEDYTHDLVVKSDEMWKKRLKLTELSKSMSPEDKLAVRTAYGNWVKNRDRIRSSKMSPDERLNEENVYRDDYRNAVQPYMDRYGGIAEETRDYDRQMREDKEMLGKSKAEDKKTKPKITEKVKEEYSDKDKVVKLPKKHLEDDKAKFHQIIDIVQSLLADDEVKKSDDEDTQSFVSNKDETHLHHDRGISACRREREEGHKISPKCAQKGLSEIEDEETDDMKEVEKSIRDINNDNSRKVANKLKKLPLDLDKKSIVEFSKAVTIFESKSGLPVSHRLRILASVVPGMSQIAIFAIKKADDEDEQDFRDANEGKSVEDLYADYYRGPQTEEQNRQKEEAARREAEEKEKAKRGKPQEQYLHEQREKEDESWVDNLNNQREAVVGQPKRAAQTRSRDLMPTEELMGLLEQEIGPFPDDIKERKDRREVLRHYRVNKDTPQAKVWQDKQRVERMKALRQEMEDRIYSSRLKSAQVANPYLADEIGGTLAEEKYRKDTDKFINDWKNREDVEPEEEGLQDIAGMAEENLKRKEGKETQAVKEEDESLRPYLQVVFDRMKAEARERGIPLADIDYYFDSIFNEQREADKQAKLAERMRLVEGQEDAWKSFLQEHPQEQEQERPQEPKKKKPVRHRRHTDKYIFSHPDKLDEEAERQKKEMKKASFQTFEELMSNRYLYKEDFTNEVISQYRNKMNEFDERLKEIHSTEIPRKVTDAEILKRFNVRNS